MLISSGCGGAAKKEQSNNDIRVYTGFFNAQSSGISPDNEIKKIIAEKTGAQCDESWLDAQDESNNIISEMIMSGKYPDFLSADSENCQKLIKSEAYIPIDNYWDDYPNIKNFFSESEWNRVRAEDGHVYYIPLFSNVYLQDTSTSHNDEAFWVQVKVLEWAGYPEIITLDDYFGMIEEYIAANPTDENGTPYIGYEILANDTYFFSLDNPPMFLDGYPNDGCCIVDPETHEAKDYNLSPTAEKWFRKLNEEYAKGIIDPDCFVMTSDQYYDKIASGSVLGIVDQKWNFGRATNELPPECTYIPIGVVAEEGIHEQYHSRIAFNGSSGVGITVSCTDPEGAMQFLNDLLSPEILTLSFWGVEGQDYEVGDDGIFYQTEEELERWKNADYAYEHVCLYNYLPYYFGMNQDGINAYCPSNQPQEFYNRLNSEVQKCFDAYNVKTYVELLNDAPDNPPWYPMWSYSVPDNTAAGKALKQIDAAKHQYLPKIVMSSDFDSVWQEYCEAYGKIDSQAYFDELTAEVQRRIEQSQ